VFLEAEMKTNWSEHIIIDGKMKGKLYYYNTKINKSCWEKPIDLMTQVEKADITVVKKLVNFKHLP
jgi:hypothetical protein